MVRAEWGLIWRFTLIDGEHRDPELAIELWALRPLMLPLPGAPGPGGTCVPGHGAPSLTYCKHGLLQRPMGLTLDAVLNALVGNFLIFLKHCGERLLFYKFCEGKDFVYNVHHFIPMLKVSGTEWRFNMYLLNQ